MKKTPLSLCPGDTLSEKNDYRIMTTADKDLCSEERERKKRLFSRMGRILPEVEPKR